MTEASGQSPAGPDAGASAEPEAAPFDAAAVAEGVIAALDAEDRPRLLEIVSEQHAADLADLIEQITREDRRRLLSALGEDIDPEMLIELGEGARDQVLKDLPPEALASAVGELETDDVVYLIEDLAPEAQAAAL
ncbi:MAG: magnesium transporter, partial [Pseudomonadota bacterium]